MRLEVADRPLSCRPFAGFGLETDVFIYGEESAKFGVAEADLQLNERRLRAVRPALARMFCWVDWWNPSLDAATYRWDHPQYLATLRMVRLLREIGCSVNLVLFEPNKGPVAGLPNLARAMVDMIERLRGPEGLDNVRWLTLFNEPDSFFVYDSPLSRKVFGDAAIGRRYTWPDYVRLNRFTHELLVERGLHPQVKLAVPDCVWGAQIRRQQMELAVRDLGDLDVDWAYHNYAPEDPSFNATAAPEFHYDGAEAEAHRFRKAVGAERPLILWEFNNAGHGFGSAFQGVGPHGEEIAGSLSSSTELVDKVFKAVSGGVDGACLWHMSDFPFGPSMNRFGLWRFKNEGWFPRPYYHYYAALCRLFRPGATLLRVEGVGGPVTALAAKVDGRLVVAVNNHAGSAATVELSLPCGGTGRRLRIHPATLPCTADQPVDGWQTCDTPSRGMDGHGAALELHPWELTVWQATSPDNSQIF